ncbi:hypothetical protein AB1Y20_011908 [Prymnesium parvum]|uniref:Uncharacterized protein n=1 Tax=Prymnesium parvum TaxID=97485 RepID=A0AB34IPF0_PRYPA
MLRAAENGDLCLNGHEGAVRLLLENNADIAARDNAGNSLLHLAAMNGHEGAVRLLLENNADTAARDNLVRVCVRVQA